MCVIMCAHRDKRISPEWVEGGFQSNPAGAGIAWRDRDTKNRPIVRWAKGLDLEQIQELVRTLPLPYCAHFRIPTCGGAIKRLTHPFPVEPTVDLALEGSIHGYVMFHNGHWGSWKRDMIETAARKGVKIPGDKWSDSRGMAWMAAHLGVGVLDLIDEKSIAFGINDTEIYGSGWTLKESVWCSNLGFERTNTTYRPGRKWSQTEMKYVDDDKEDTQSKSTDTTDGQKTGTSPTDHPSFCKCIRCVRAKGVAGGDPTESPFLQAKRLLKEGEELWEMSKNQKHRLISKNEIKRRRKELEKQESLLIRERVNQQMLELTNTHLTH